MKYWSLFINLFWLEALVTQNYEINPYYNNVDGCNDGFFRDGKSCYLISDTMGSWNEGLEDCQSKGATLFVPDENNIANSLLC